MFSNLLGKIVTSVFGDNEKPESVYYLDYEIYLVPMWKTSGEKYYFIQINKNGREVNREVNEYGDSKETILKLARIWIDAEVRYGQL